MAAFLHEEIFFSSSRYVSISYVQRLRVLPHSESHEHELHHGLNDVSNLECCDVTLQKLVYGRRSSKSSGNTNWSCAVIYLRINTMTSITITSVLAIIIVLRYASAMLSKEEQRNAIGCIQVFAFYIITHTLMTSKCILTPFFAQMVIFITNYNVYPSHIFKIMKTI